jgi:hypothetical protein
MSEDKTYTAYVFQGTTYLAAKWANYDTYKAIGVNGETIEGVKHSGHYPDYIKFDGVVSAIYAYKNISPKEVLFGYTLKEKFIGLPNRPLTLPPDYPIVDLEIYDTSTRVVETPPEETILPVNFIQKDHTPEIPKWCKYEDIYRWHIVDLSDLSKYECYIQPSDAFDMLCRRFKDIVEKNPEIYSDYQQHIDCGSYKWVRCYKIKVGDRLFYTRKSYEIELTNYMIRHSIKGKNFEDLNSKLEAWINDSLNNLLSDITVDLPIFPSKLKVGQHNYFEVDDFAGSKWVCVKMHPPIYREFSSRMKDESFLPKLKKSSIGKIIFPVMEAIRREFIAEPKYKINR